MKEQEVIDGINRQIEKLLSDEEFNRLKKEMEELTARSVEEIAAFKQQLKINKQGRKESREENKNSMDDHNYALLEADLAKQSHYDRHRMRLLIDQWKHSLEDMRTKLVPMERMLEALKNERKERSAALQQQLFEQYSFLNKAGKSKSLQDIFSATAFGTPAAAGECATPKLLQFAFVNGYKPLAMAEFWWGAAPRSEVRKHKQFYPACAGKCKPILAHMLEGVPMDENPFLQPSQENTELKIVCEDEYLLVVNKPSGLRSVPGVDIYDSVYTKLGAILVNTEPFMVHRLDMGTSGLMVVAKSQQVHKHLQKQFLDRLVSKRYTALLSKVIEEDGGEIRLPLCADPYNRPMQLVCFKTGKTSVTRWKAVERTGATTKVHFWPLTGRTHQLRMHAAHELGLNAPIVGDDLYGTSDQRLYLHAAELAFVHPKTKEKMSFEVAEDF